VPQGVDTNPLPDEVKIYKNKFSIDYTETNDSIYVPNAQALYYITA